MTERALLYIRVSTTAQSDEGTSLDTQEDRCRQYAADHGYSIVALESDVATGAQYRERLGLSRLREMVRAGLADVVVCHAIDRLSRQQSHLYIIAEECQDHGTRLEFVTESFEDSAVGRFLRSAKAFAAEVEREKIAERSIRGKLARLHSGRLIIPHQALYGYQPNADRTAYLVNPATAPIVQRIYRSVLDGQTLRQIALSLAADGIPSPSGRDRWSVSQISNILRHPAYTGRALAHYRVRGNGRASWDFTDALELPAGTIPRLVDDATWQAAHARLARNKLHAARNTHEPLAALLRGGVARCGGCGRSLTVIDKGPAHGGLAYACRQYSQPALPCLCPVSMQVQRLDAAVWRQIVQLIHEPEALLSGRVDADRGPALAAEASRLDGMARDLARRQRNLTRALSDLDDAATAAVIRADLVSVTSQLRAVETERASLGMAQRVHAAAVEDAAEIAVWCERMARRLPGMGAAERRMVVEMLSVEVVVYQRGHRPRWVMELVAPSV